MGVMKTETTNVIQITASLMDSHISIVDIYVYGCVQSNRWGWCRMTSNLSVNVIRASNVLIKLRICCWYFHACAHIEHDERVNPVVCLFMCVVYGLRTHYTHAYSCILYIWLIAELAPTGTHVNILKYTCIVHRVIYNIIIIIHRFPAIEQKSKWPLCATI